uniref:Uncharacterized protein n=1 Tax=Caenorhabditis japonica TaxID=281687 RepID=A0A8R1EVP1_CAEJA
MSAKCQKTKTVDATSASRFRLQPKERTIPRKFCKLMGPNGYELDDVCNACLDDECSKSNQMWKRRSYSKMSLFG